jgi:hypothetical protein
MQHFRYKIASKFLDELLDASIIELDGSQANGLVPAVRLACVMKHVYDMFEALGSVSKEHMSAIYCHKDKVPALGTKVEREADYFDTISGGRVMRTDKDFTSFFTYIWDNHNTRNAIRNGEGAMLILDRDIVVGVTTVEVKCQDQ